MYKTASDPLVETCLERVLAQSLVARLGHALIDHLDHRLAVLDCHHNVGRFDVALYDAFLMACCPAMADRQESVRDAPVSSGCTVSLFGMGTPLTSSIREGAFRSGVGPPIVESGQCAVIHQGHPRLSLRRESGDHLSGVPAGLE